MIIFGTTTIRTTPQTGSFSCPRCSMQRTYRHKRANRFFTLYFIPLIPLGTAGEWIECASCGGTFGVEVLSYNPEAERQDIVESARRVLILLMLEANATDSDNVQALRHFCSEALGASVADYEIQQDVQLAQEANAHFVPFAQSKLSDLNNRGKELIIQGALYVLAPGGYPSDAQKSLVRQLAIAMLVPPQHVESLLSGSQQPRLGP